MTFYDKYCELCKGKGVSPSRAALDMGLNKGAVSVWKKRPGLTPTIDTLTKVAKYFSVEMNELLDIEKSVLETEDGRRIILNPTEEELRRYLPTLTQEQKESLLALMKSMINK